MGQDNILHFGSMRGRIRGSGILRARLFDLDDTKTTPFPLITMTATTGKFVFKLINFKSQRACLELKTTDKDEVMRVNKIVVFARAIFGEYPA